MSLKADVMEVKSQITSETSPFHEAIVASDESSDSSDSRFSSLKVPTFEMQSKNSPSSEVSL